MPQKKLTFWSGLGVVITVILLSFEVPNFGDPNPGADIAALRSMHAIPDSANMESSVEAGEPGPGLLKIWSTYGKLIPKTVRMPGQFDAYEELLQAGIRNPSLLKTIANETDITEDDRLIDPNFDCKQAFGRFVQSDIDRVAHPDHYTGDLKDDSNGILHWLKEHTSNPRSVRRYAAEDLQLWRHAFEAFPKGRVDPRTSLDTLVQVQNKFHPPQSESYIQFQSNYRRAISLNTNWLLQIARAREIRSAARLLLAHLETGKTPGTLPDYGDDSINPLSNKPFLYHTTENGFEITTASARSSGKSLSFSF